MAAHTLVPLQPDSISAVALLFLPLVLFAALGAGRELFSPSLTELAFYSFAIVAAGDMAQRTSRRSPTRPPASRDALAFMGFVFALAIALGVVAMKLLAGRDSET